MPRTVTVNAFAAASARYVESAVSRANANGNAYLTKTEAKQLPTDLRDNFEHYRQTRTSNGVVAARVFTREYAEYVKDAAKRADVNGDGVIAATELTKLPENLQDNFVKFAGISAPPELEPITNVRMPMSEANLERVRAAFVDYVENTLTVRRPSEWDEGFEYDNGSWAKLVREFGGDDEHEALKAEALELARSWRPNSDWMMDTTSQGGVYFTGHFKFITLFVELEQGKVPSFMDEVD